MVNEIPDVVFLTLFGDYDASRGVELEAQLAEARSADIAVIDMGAVTLFDSTAISALVRLKKRMSWKGGPTAIRLINCSEKFERVMRLVGMDAVFEMHGGAKDALGHLGHMRYAI
ncbi:MAG TPA: STAS domain-containing protein [Candidatus Baltobacteraceae bacterium]|jgi:anti-anti-sigma factor